MRGIGGAGLIHQDVESVQSIERALTERQILAACAGLQNFWKDFHEGLVPAGWSEDLLLHSDLLLYRHADAGESGEIVHSMEYGRTRTKESFHVRVSYMEAGDVQADYVASVRFFLKVSPAQ